jgi:hypothetical protein
MSPLRASNAPAPAYAPVTPSAAADAPGRRSSKRISAAVPVPEASTARRPPPPSMATPGPACRALAVSSRRTTSICSRATATATCSTPVADIRPLVTRSALREPRCPSASALPACHWPRGDSHDAAGGGRSNRPRFPMRRLQLRIGRALKSRNSASAGVRFDVPGMGTAGVRKRSRRWEFFAASAVQ